jgi:hypothetical protein
MIGNHKGNAMQAQNRRSNGVGKTGKKGSRIAAKSNIMARPKRDKDNPESRQVKYGQTVTFRPPDQGFADAFNMALKVSGMSVNELVIRSIRSGLPSTLEQIVKEAKEKKNWEQHVRAIFEMKDNLDHPEGGQETANDTDPQDHGRSADSGRKDS